MNTQPSTFEVAAESFQEDVIERSRQSPVVILFWAEQVPESVQMRNTFAALVEQYAGKFALGLADVARDQSLAQHLRVQGLPSLRIVHEGQIVDQKDGPQDETVLREMLDALTMSGSDKIADQLAALLQNGNVESALALVRQALLEEPNNSEFKVEYADLLVRDGDLAAAQKVLSDISEEVINRKRPAMRLSLTQEVQDFPELGELQAALESDPDNLHLRYQIALRYVTDFQYEAGLEMCLGIMQADRNYEEELARKTMIRIFDLLDKENPLTGQYRRRMFAFLH